MKPTAKMAAGVGLTDTLLSLAEREVEEGRQRLACQEQLVRDLIHHRCSLDLVILAERLLRRTREQQAQRERHLAELQATAGHLPNSDRSHNPIEWHTPATPQRFAKRQPDPRGATVG